VLDQFTGVRPSAVRLVAKPGYFGEVSLLALEPRWSRCRGPCKQRAFWRAKPAYGLTDVQGAAVDVSVEGVADDDQSLICIEAYHTRRQRPSHYGESGVKRLEVHLARHDYTDVATSRSIRYFSPEECAQLLEHREGRTARKYCG
jgi:hypothetical protein